jgi:hypothetical protein
MRLQDQLRELIGLIVFRMLQDVLSEMLSRRWSLPRLLW